MNGVTNKSPKGKSAIAYKAIKDMIIKNEIKCGEIVSENKLAAMLSMSRTPIREAIHSLFEEGYVEVLKGIGILIKHVTIMEIRDVCSVRVLLESFAIRNSADLIDPNRLDRISNQWSDLKKRIAEGAIDYKDELFALDGITHSIFFEYCGNEVLEQMFESLKIKVQRYQQMFTKVTDDDISTSEQHIEILNAVKNKNLDLACELLNKHVFTPLNSLLSNSREIY